MDASYVASIPPSDFSLLDASLRLSANGALEDCFECLPEREMAAPCFAGSNRSLDLSVLLSNASHHSALLTGSAMDLGGIISPASASPGALDCVDDDALRGSFGTACSIHDPLSHSDASSGTDALNRSHRSKKPRRRMIERHEGRYAAEGEGGAADPRFQMRAVNFDPPAPSPAAEEDRRRRQLKRLAASMRRTEASRKCVLLQRELLFTPEQLRQIRETKDELRRRLASAMQLCRAQQQQQQPCAAVFPAPPQCGAFQSQITDPTWCNPMAIPSNPVEPTSFFTVSGAQALYPFGQQS